MVTLVTGNPHKLAELLAMAPAGFACDNRRLDLLEPQSLDMREIVEHKVRQAYELVGGPVIVEDVGAGLQSLHGLPGPFVKFFEQQLGRGALFKLSKVAEDRVTITCLAAYFDGRHLLFGEGVVHGTIVKPRGSHGFGFDCCVVPDGQTLTMAELPPETKNQLSHRGQAFRLLLDKLS